MIRKFTPTSLRQRTILYVLMPTLIILLVAGDIGFHTGKDILLNQWTELANQHLKNAASQIDRRLEAPRRLLLLLQDAPGGRRGYQTHQFLIGQLKMIQGVIAVNVDWPGLEGDPSMNMPMKGKAKILTRYHDPIKNLEATVPKYTSELKNGQHISLTSEYLDSNNDVVGKVEVVISFLDLIGDISKSSWWLDNRSFIIDRDGRALGSSNSTTAQQLTEHNVGDHGVIDKDAWAEMQGKKLGTIFGEGKPPKDVCVFYQLDQAPWTLVVVAPGKSVLQPLIDYRRIYLFVTFSAILIILLIIYVLTSLINKDINQVSDAAAELAQGHFGKPLPVRSRDEIGALSHNFNEMTEQLRQGVQLQKAMQIAHEVQQTLLPDTGYHDNGIEIAGTSQYSDETGGDYFDILQFNKESKKLAVAVADVVGHGIGAALLMATTRALLRSRLGQPGDIGEITSDVNSLLCKDTMEANNFVTLFLMLIDTDRQTFSWVRAGHEPAIVYTPASKEFGSLLGQGIALGISDDFSYQQENISFSGEEQIILVGSDGVWDAENEMGEQFGKERVHRLMQETAHFSAQEIVKHIIQAINAFQGDNKQTDDITLVIIKTPAKGN